MPECQLRLLTQLLVQGSPFPAFGLKCACHGINCEHLAGPHHVIHPAYGHYIGQWSQGLCHGQGRWMHPGLAVTYQGEWFMGEWQGAGVFFFADGDVLQGNFQRSSPLAGMLRRKNDNSLAEVRFDGRTKMLDPDLEPVDFKPIKKKKAPLVL